MGVRLIAKGSGSAELSYDFEQPKIVIGRSSSSDVQLPHAGVSAHHASVIVKGTGYAVVDEGSTNGTWIDGKPVPAGRQKKLSSGDTIQIGGFSIRVEVGRAVAAVTSVDRTAAFARRLLRVDKSVDEPRLVVRNGPQAGVEIVLPPPPAVLRLGRGEGCDFTLVDGDASREHVDVRVEFDGVMLVDLGSKNPTLVNGASVSEDSALRHQDVIRIGSTLFDYEDPAEDALASLREQQDLVVAHKPITEESARSVETADDDDNAKAQNEEAGSAEFPARDADADPPEAEFADEESAADGASDPALAHTVLADADSADEARANHAAAGGALPSPHRAPRIESSKSSGGADLFIYVLAAIVLAISLVGLVYLLRAG